jgi:hypothetical protein
VLIAASIVPGLESSMLYVHAVYCGVLVGNLA